MHFKERLQQEMTRAAKAKEKIHLSAVRLMISAVHNREIDLKRGLTEAEFLQVLTSMVKQRRDSIEQFQRGGRADLVAQEEEEIRVIQAYLPEPISEETLSAEIDRVVTEVGAAGVKDLGKVMKAIVPRLAGRIDGRILSERVKARLVSMA